jgi:hypothetical protein
MSLLWNATYWLLHLCESPSLSARQYISRKPEFQSLNLAGGLRSYRPARDCIAQAGRYGLSPLSPLRRLNSATETPECGYAFVFLLTWSPELFILACSCNPPNLFGLLAGNWHLRRPRSYSPQKRYFPQNNEFLYGISPLKRMYGNLPKADQCRLGKITKINVWKECTEIS